MAQSRVSSGQVSGGAMRLTALTAGLWFRIGMLAAWFVFVHVLAFSPRRASIFSSNRGISIGLIS